MPNNKKEGIIFGLFMLSGMVLIMFSYNLIISGLWKMMTMGELLLNLGVVFVAAFLLESFVVRPIAKKSVSVLSYNKESKLKNIIVMSTLMVIGMVGCMSFYGLFAMWKAGGVEGSLVQQYIQFLGRNFIVAYPAQLLIIGPVSRWMLVSFIQSAGPAKEDKTA